MVVLMVVICFDVLSRKLGFQIPGMGSAPLQELEWHRCSPCGSASAAS